MGSGEQAILFSAANEFGMEQKQCTMLAVTPENAAFGPESARLILDGDENPLIGDIRVKEGMHTVMIVNGAPIYDSPIFLRGRNYTTIYNMIVREKPSLKGRRLEVTELTKNARLFATSSGALRKGTKVTCKDTATADGITWLKIPSGWIAGYNTEEGFAYVK